MHKFRHADGARLRLCHKRQREKAAQEVQMLPGQEQQEEEGKRRRRWKGGGAEGLRGKATAENNIFISFAAY